MLMSCVLSLLISPTFSNLALVAASALQGRKKEGEGEEEGDMSSLVPRSHDATTKNAMHDREILEWLGEGRVSICKRERWWEACCNTE